MSGGYRPLPEDDLARLVQDIDKIRSDIRQLQMPTGTQLFEATKKLEEALNSIGTYVDAYLQTGFTTGSMTATGSVSAGSVSAGSVSAAGNVTAGGSLDVTGNADVDGVLRVPGAYNNNLTGVGGYKVAYWGIDGQAGYVPSSLRFKRDVEDAAIDTDALLQVEPVRYRYKDAVANLGDDAPTEVGVIAEQVDALGLTWLVDYDDGGQPISVRYDRLAVGLISVVQSLAERVAALET